MRTTTAAALAVAVALAPTACGHPDPPAAAPAVPPPTAAPVPHVAPEPPAPPPTPPPDPNSVDRNSPDAVAAAVVALNYTIDTDTVNSWTTAARRAAPLLTPDYAGRLATAPSPAPDAQWSTWTAHHAYTTIQLQPAAEPHPPDTPSTAARAVNLTTTPYGRDNWHGDPSHYEVFVLLTHTNQGWSASNLLAR